MSRAGKVAIAGTALLAAALVAYRIYLSSLSEEDRIRAMVKEIALGFNEGNAGDVTRRLTSDFTEKTSGLEKKEIHALLAHFFLTAKDRKSGETLYQVVIAPDGIQVERSQEEPASAKITVTARFLPRAAQGDAGKAALVLFRGTLAKVDGEWKIAGASHELLEGRWPF